MGILGKMLGTAGRVAGRAIGDRQTSLVDSLAYRVQQGMSTGEIRNIDDALSQIAQAHGPGVAEQVQQLVMTQRAGRQGMLQMFGHQ